MGFLHEGPEINLHALVLVWTPRRWYRVQLQTGECSKQCLHFQHPFGCMQVTTCQLKKQEESVTAKKGQPWVRAGKQEFYFFDTVSITQKKRLEWRNAVSSP